MKDFQATHFLNYPLQLRTCLRLNHHHYYLKDQCKNQWKHQRQEVLGALVTSVVVMNFAVDLMLQNSALDALIKEVAVVALMCLENAE